MVRHLKVAAHGYRFLKKMVLRLPAPGITGLSHHDQDYMSHCKKNCNGSHSHMPSEGNTIEPLQHENPRCCCCYKTEERGNPQSEYKGTANNHEIRNRSTHTLLFHNGRTIHRRMNRTVIGLRPLIRHPACPNARDQDLPVFVIFFEGRIGPGGLV